MAPSKRDAIQLAVVLAVVLGVVLGPFLFGAFSLLSSAQEAQSIYDTAALPNQLPIPYRTLDAGAPAWLTEPDLAMENRIAYQEHRLPFWDPDDGYGQPFAATMQPQPFYPLTALAALHPSPRVYAWWIAARLFVLGWFAALFLRLFVSRFGAAIGGIAVMLSGYYLLYINMPHLSVEVLIPMVLWATELVCRRTTALRVAALAGTAALVYLGGMPESALLVLSVGALYGVLRMIVIRRRQAVPGIAVLIGAHVLGAAAAAVQLLPFVELMGRSFNTHSGAAPGLGYDGFWRLGLLTEFAPRVFGAPWNSILTNGNGWSGVRGFFGCAASFFALVAVMRTLRVRDERMPVILFLAAVVAYCVLKRFGNPLVLWTGGLPLFSLVQFSKYGEAVVGTALGLLAGFGVDYLWKRSAGYRTTLAAFAVMLATMTFLYFNSHAIVSPTAPGAYWYLIALDIAMAALVAAGGLALLLGGEGRRLRVAVAIGALIVAEPFAGYIFPTLWHRAPSINANPYAGAPYLSWLAQHVVRANERIFGLGGMLFPDWAGAYGFADPRSLNALYPKNYLKFVDAFVSTSPSPFDDQYDRFTAMRPISLASPLVRRWMTLSSVGYILTDPAHLQVPSPPESVVDDLWRQVGPGIPAAEVPAVHPTALSINGNPENSLFEHPPHAVTFTERIERGHPWFAADAGFDPASYAGPTVCGGPVTFTIEVSAGGARVASTSRIIDAKHNLADRRWLPMAVDLTRIAGRSADITLRTDAIDLCSEWVVWGEPRLVARRPAGPQVTPPGPFPVVYSGPNISIMRVDGSMPRVTLFHAVQTAPSFEDAMHQIVAPGFDVRHTVVLEGVPPPAVHAESGSDVAVVTASRSDRIDIDANAAGDAILMQNDTIYPGWTATVDGRSVSLIPADGLFRAIPLPAGRHHVAIFYRSTAVTIGIAVSAAGLVALIALASLGFVRRARWRAAP